MLRCTLTLDCQIGEPRITKRGIEQKLIIGGGIMAPVPRNEAMVKAVARAYFWFEDIRMRRVNDLSERAADPVVCAGAFALGLPHAEYRGCILEGRQPPDLSLKQLMYRTDLSISWTAQRQQLGFDA